MSFDGRSIANYVLDFCDARGRAVTPFALQKIVYFCHVWSLVTLEKPLVKHAFEAWEHGPVLPYLYRDFKAFGDNPITSRAEGLDKATGARRPEPYHFDDEMEALVGRIVDFYSRLSFSELYARSHATGGPWEKVWRHGGEVNPGMRIDNSEIKNFYSRNKLSS